MQSVLCIWRIMVCTTMRLSPNADYPTKVCRICFPRNFGSPTPPHSLHASPLRAAANLPRRLISSLLRRQVSSWLAIEAHAAWHNLPDDTSFKEWSQDQLTKGHVVVTTYNVTSFITHEAFLTSLPGSLLAAQEVGCRMEAALRLKARLSKQGYSVQLGPAPQSKVYSNRSSDTAAIGGLLVAATQGGLTPLAQDLPDALQVPRVQA